MKQYSSYIGIDLGDKTSRVCVTDSAGTVVKEFSVRTKAAPMVDALGKWPQSLIAIETGTHSPWVARTLEAAGHSVVLSNARQVALIHRSVKKSDELDARTLARLVRVDPELLSPVHVRSERTQADAELVKARDALVRSRAALINHVRGAVKSLGARIEKCSADSFARKAKAQIPQALSAALEPLREQIASITKTILAYEAQIEELCQTAYPETKQLRQIAGVGPVTSLAYVLVIEDPARFKNGRQVGPYLGLTPRRDQSGERDPQLRITKAGDKYLRRLLVSAAQYILGHFGPDTALRRWGLAKAQGSKRNKRRAVVAVARKLAVLLHLLWSTGVVYEPFPDSGHPLDESSPSLEAVTT